MNATWLEGCDKFGYLKGDILTDSLAGILESAYVGGVREVRIRTIQLSNVDTFGVSARFNCLGEDLKVYIEEMSYEELVPMFAKITAHWDVEFYDKDGNLLVCSEENGAVACVKDADGNIIWEAEK